MTAVSGVRRAQRSAYRRGVRFGTVVFEYLSVPGLVFVLFMSPRIHKDYAMTWPRKLALVAKILRASRAVPSPTPYKAQLVMATRILETPPSMNGVVVQCGREDVGTTAALSLACEITGRELVVYDPAPAIGDGSGDGAAGSPKGQERVRRFGALDRCTFRGGPLSETLPRHSEPVVLAFVDVDDVITLADCVTDVWPHLTRDGYLFIGQYTRLEQCALFFSERYWREVFDQPPPGMLGGGTGMQVGQLQVNVAGEWVLSEQGPRSVGYTRRDYYGMWDFYPEDQMSDDEPPGDGGSLTA